MWKELLLHYGLLLKEAITWTRFLLCLLLLLLMVLYAWLHHKESLLDAKENTLLQQVSLHKRRQLLLKDKAFVLYKKDIKLAKAVLVYINESVRKTAHISLVSLNQDIIKKDIFKKKWLKKGKFQQLRITLKLKSRFLPLLTFIKHLSDIPYPTFWENLTIHIDQYPLVIASVRFSTVVKL